MKYIEYLLILLWHLSSKVIGLVWFFVAVPFRHYARNVVYNYVLDNGIYLKRLQERTIIDNYCHYVIKPYHGANGGYIDYRKISWLKYKLVYYFIWGFLDDDANDDTFDMGRVEELRKSSKIWALFLYGVKRNQYGNSFDLGDAIQPNFHFFASMFWNNRNTAQNFLYMQFQKKEQPFLHIIFGYSIGWVLAEDGKSYQLSYSKAV